MVFRGRDGGILLTGYSSEDQKASHTPYADAIVWPSLKARATLHLGCALLLAWSGVGRKSTGVRHGVLCGEITKILSYLLTNARANL